MKQALRCLALSVFLLPSYFLPAQEVHPVSGEPLLHCGTDEAVRESYALHPEYKQVAAILEEQIKNAPPATQSTPSPIYIIPVVFHILHNYGPENISDDQIKDEMRILNLDYRKLNPDTTQVVAAFKGLVADIGIEFRLAQLDPSGNCTNGIDRIVTSKTYKADNTSKLNDWPYNKYLNVWVCHDIGSGAAGYSYYPGSTSTAYDGVMIRHDYIGSIGTSSYTTSRALSHEIGHYLNLQHTWGGTNNPGVACGDDGVNDTPVTKGWNNNCNLSSNDICNAGVQENVQNYMEYAYCQRMFTLGQASRMRTATANSNMSRNNLWSAGNLAVTGATATPQLCTADFSVSSRVVCAGTAVTFSDLSWNGTPTSWQWDFDNDGVVDDTVKNPVHTYSVAGIYGIKLTAGDGTVTRTVTKSAYLTVVGNTATVQAPFSEGFESTGYPYADWYNNNMNANYTYSWARTTAAAYTDSASLKLNNFSATSTNIYEFITPSVDVSTLTSPGLTFRVAYARKSANDTLDQLRVLTSTNCGVTWVQRYMKAVTTLPTTSVTPTAFIPSGPSEWRQDAVNIGNTLGQTNVRFRFEFTGHGIGNNIYIDDINIDEKGSGILEEAANNFDLNIYPNPFDVNSTLSFNLQERHAVSIGIYDLLGKRTGEIAVPAELGAGSYSLPLTRDNLNPGVYFVKLSVDGYPAVKKIVVQ